MVVILSSGHAFQTLIPELRFLKFPVSLFFIIPIIKKLNFEEIRRFNSLSTFFLIFVVMNLLTGTFYTFKGLGGLTYLGFFSTIVISFGIVISYDLKAILIIFKRVMISISLVSLLGYILSNYSEILTFLPTITNVNGYDYRIGFIFNYIPIVSQRNFGMFWEPGIFATYLSVVLFMDVLDNKKLFTKILLITTIISTKSAIGYIILTNILLFSVLFYRKDVVHFNKKSFVLLIIFILIILFIPLKRIKEKQLHYTKLF